MNLIMLATLWGSVTMPQIVHAQSNLEVFGQNRKQEKKKFDWKYFDTKHFRVYHYDKAGRQLGRYVAEEAEMDVAVIEKKLGGAFPPRFNIMLYNSYDEYRQSNIGLKDEVPTVGNSRAGSLKVVDDKLVVYFTGAHTDLRRQIKSGMALVVMQHMIFGDDLKKRVKNALLLNLPPWVTEGYISYLVDGWDQESNSQWMALLQARPNTGFFELSNEYPELAGKAFWKFVSNQYGDSKVKGLLYSMQQKTSLNKAMLDPDNLGMKVTKAYDSCINFYKHIYTLDAKNQRKPDSTGGVTTLKVPKDNSIVRNITISPSGTDVSYVVWKEGRFTVYTQRTGNPNVNPLLEGGKKDLTEQIDPNYPMLAWSPTGSKLAMLYRKGKQTRLRIYNNARGRVENYVIPANRFDRVLSMAFLQDDDKLVFSAIKKSQSDLYLFTIKGSKMTNITDDTWDDVSPKFVTDGGRTGILFLSNRPKPNLNVPVAVNELPAGPFNVFFYNTVSMRPELLQCSDVGKGHITQPIQYGPEHFAYLYDSSGITNRYVVNFARNTKNEDSAYALPVTNYNTNILSHQYNASSGDVSDVIQIRDKYVLYIHDLQMPGDSGVVEHPVPTILSKEWPEPPMGTPGAKRSAIEPLVPVPEPKSDLYPGRYADEQKPKPQVKSGNIFQSEFDDNEEQPVKKARPVVKKTDGAGANGADEVASTDADSSVLSEISDSAYLKMKPTAYKKSFIPDFISVKLDNSILFNQYQSIDANGGEFVNPALGLMPTISLNELLEDQRVNIGFQLPLDLNYSAYFLQYQNYKRRLDWGLMALRRQNRDYKGVAYIDSASGIAYGPYQQLFQSVSNMVQADFSYPLDRMRSLRFHTGVREDGFIQKVTDTLSHAIDFPRTRTYTEVSRFEYVFDNTISPMTNILRGTRYKVYTEYMYGLNKGNKSCYNIGLDFRNYQPLYKNIILANRIAYGHSDGNKMVQYLLGGVDNWMFPQTSTASTEFNENYGFQMLATSLRGYKQKARAGNNFAVVSTEIRVPVAATFVKRPVQSAALKNLQLVAFTDVGTTWKGFVPTKDNLSNTFNYPQYGDPRSLNNVLLTLTVPYGSALTAGFGGGIRTSLFGYFIRTDVAWNAEGDKKPIIYFALGTDF
jgi:Tol biopolymer transport system component